MRLSNCRSTLACVATLMLLPASTLCAQVQSPQSPSGENEEVVTLLPTFEVRSGKDEGYIAADTISAGRLSTNMLTTPSDVSVLTKDFLNDLNLFNIQEALKWLPGASVNDPFTVAATGDPRDFGNNVTFRGLPTGGTTRNYFSYSTTVEDYMLERIDGTRGPNSILYGTSLSGGSINATTKRAEFRNFMTLTPRLDTLGSQRLAIDVNRVLTKQLAARLNVVVQDQHLWIDRARNKLTAGDLTLTYRPWRGGEFRLEGEVGLKQTSIVANQMIDYASKWDRTTAVTGPLTASPAGATGLVRFTTDTLVMSNAWSGILNFINYAKTDGTRLVMVPENAIIANFPLIDRKSANLQPPNLVSKNQYGVVQAFFEQRFESGLLAEVAFSAAESTKRLNSQIWTAVYQDPNRVLPNGATNPNYGKFYSETTLNSLRVKVPNYDTSLRGSLAYPFATSWMNQTLSLVASRTWTRFAPLYFRPGRSNGSNPSITNSANLISYRQYFDDPDVPLTLPEDSNGYKIAYGKSRDTNQGSRLDSLQLNSIGSYLKDRLTVIGGVRRDDYRGHVSDISAYDVAGQASAYSALNYHSRVDTYAVGATYFPVRAAGVYVNYSEGFSPSLQQFPPLPGNPSIQATTSDVYSGGIRLRLWDGKLVGSIGYYHSTERNRIQSVSTSQINAIWTYLNKAEKIPTVTTSYFDTFDYEGSGYEADLTANVSQNFKLKANVVLPETEQANSLPASKAYLAANLAEWQAGAVDTTNPNRAAIASNLATYQNTVYSAVDGRAVNGTYDWTANVFGVYTFNQGRLKGLRVGGGMNYFARRLIGNQYNQPLNFIYADGYRLYSAVLGYGFKVRKVPVDVQVNVTNLLDYSDPVFGGTTVYSNVTYRGSYSYVQPRTATFSASLRF